MNSVGVTDGIVLNSGLEGKSSSYLKKYYQRLRSTKCSNSVPYSKWRKFFNCPLRPMFYKWNLIGLPGSYRWEALQAEMRIDMQRIWKRNLGRDDRCMADSGKEVRIEPLVFGHSGGIIWTIGRWWQWEFNILWWVSSVDSMVFMLNCRPDFHFLMKRL